MIIAYTGDPDERGLNVAKKEIFHLSGENDSGEMKYIQVGDKQRARPFGKNFAPTESYAGNTGQAFAS